MHAVIQPLGIRDSCVDESSWAAQLGVVRLSEVSHRKVAKAIRSLDSIQPIGIVIRHSDSQDCARRFVGTGGSGGHG